jgi:hypothetical protein
MPRAVKLLKFWVGRLRITPGVSRATPSKPTMPFSVRSFCEKAVMLSGTSCSRSARRVAVTMIS